MPVRYPLEYSIGPQTLSAGRQWMLVRLKHLGAVALTALDVRLNSLDAYSISVFGSGSFVSVLEPGQETLLPFQVMAKATARLYTSVDGWQDEEAFHWETPSIGVAVGEEAAELLTFFVLTGPYLSHNETVRCEAAVRGLRSTSGLNLEFWSDAPNGSFRQLSDINIISLEEDETVRYTAEFTPDEEGVYTLYTYLYDGMRRIGKATDTLYVSSA